MSIQIRPARTDEFDAVSAIIDAAWSEYDGRVSGSEERAQAYRNYRSSMLRTAERAAEPGALVAVAADDDDVLGSVTYYGPVSSGADGDETGEGWPPSYGSIRLLGVHPVARGRGVGRLMTEWCIDRARSEGATHVGLHTTPMMAVAKAMYLRMGFTRVERYDIVIDETFIIEAYDLPLRS